jgi:hypothetical protein
MDTSPRVARTDGDHGWRVGESHHRATIPDEVVHEMRDLHEHKRLRYAQIIELFAQRDPPVILRYHNVRKICNYYGRCYT